MTYVATIGQGSMDVSSQYLAPRLGVPIVRTDIYQTIAERFNRPLVGPATVKAWLREVPFVIALNRMPGPLHLSNHHLGRYGAFLRKPFLITVHDLIRYLDLIGKGPLIHRPNLRDRCYLRLDYLGIRRAMRVITVSHYSKSDLMRHLGIPEQRIRVVYGGIDHQLYRPVPGPSLVPHPYILFVGAEHPRKNLPTLLRAFRRLKEDPQWSELKLVKVGRPGGPEADFREPVLAEVRRLGLEQEVIFANYVPQEQLPRYYSCAECFVFPSLYEGFGMPLVEAMACGCPVVSSNVTSVPEVVGDAAITVDPLDDAALAAALRRVLTDGARREALVARGYERARLFSWDRAARETTAVYREVEEEIGRHEGAATPAR